jgi:kynurenine 3-monooxygenase
MADGDGYRVCIVGAGLAGTLTGLLLSKLGCIQVSVYEKREDYRYCCLEKDSGELDSKVFGTSTSATKRSINLALSERGMIALKEVGALETVMKHAVRMPCRVIHSINKPDVKQAYGQANEAIWSVGRKLINTTLLQMAEHDANLQLFFGYSFVCCSDDGICTFESPSGRVVTDSFDLVIGADGAYSSVRDSMLRKGRINFSRQYIAHGYKELSIPPVLKPVLGSDEQSHVEDYALSNPEGLHIWPRKEFMLIAIPNPDKSFTATLFAPYKGR